MSQLLTRRRHIQEWNLRYPVGTPVKYWASMRKAGEPRTSRTRSPAFMVSFSSPQVRLEGVVGSVSLVNVEPLGGAS